MRGKEKQIFMGGFTVCKILGVDKVPCGCEPEKRAEKKRASALFWGVSFPINFTPVSKRSIKASWVEQRQRATWHPSPLPLQEPSNTHPKKANERKLVELCVLLRTSKAPSFVHNPINVTKVTLPQDNPRRSLWAPADFFSLPSFCD